MESKPVLLRQKVVINEGPGHVDGLGNATVGSKERKTQRERTDKLEKRGKSSKGPCLSPGKTGRQKTAEERESKQSAQSWVVSDYPGKKDKKER